MLLRCNQVVHILCVHVFSVERRFLGLFFENFQSTFMLRKNQKSKSGYGKKKTYVQQKMFVFRYRIGASFYRCIANVENGCETCRKCNKIIDFDGILVDSPSIPKVCSLCKYYKKIIICAKTVQSVPDEDSTVAVSLLA